MVGCMGYARVNKIGDKGGFVMIALAELYI